ncbi:hypothetical protein BC829DRAFT_396501 [Chytridium lagenaria]|nr:hypothetical protein BC829DRAFT_396501 [Chytridium lagenaria]
MYPLYLNHHHLLLLLLLLLNSMNTTPKPRFIVAEKLLDQKKQDHGRDVPVLVESDAIRKYDLKMRQQPIRARSCGSGDKDRRVIDPVTPIIELIATDPDGTLVDPQDLTAELSSPTPPSGPPTVNVASQPPQNPKRLPILVGDMPDVSVRIEGEFLLKFYLVDLAK